MSLQCLDHNMESYSGTWTSCTARDNLYRMWSAAERSKRRSLCLSGTLALALVAFLERVQVALMSGSLSCRLLSLAIETNSDLILQYGAYMEDWNTNWWVDIVIAERCNFLDHLNWNTLSLLNTLKFTWLTHDFGWIIIEISLFVDRFGDICLIFSFQLLCSN
jgi:hypothetical protein